MDKNLSTYYDGKYNKYIGARYVPLLDGEWDNKKKYEPLVVVLYKGSSYTSKTFVPVGADINDSTYWVCTANFNAQVEAYRNDVVALSKEVSKNTNSIESLENEVSKNTNSIESLKNEKHIMQGKRIKKNWLSDHDVRCYVPEMWLNGFRFLGQYLTPSNKKYIPVDPYIDFSIIDDKKYIDRTTGAWVCNMIYYTPTGVKKAVVPFAEVKSIDGSSVTLKPISFCGAFDDSLGTFDFTGVKNIDVLQIHRNKKFEGRLLKATNGTANILTLEDTSTVSVGDFVLIAPSSEDYLYLNSYVIDQSNNILNFGDDGEQNLMYGVVLDVPLNVGENTIDVSKGVSPLSTAINIRIDLTFSTATTGSCYIAYGSDSSHTPYSYIFNKTTSESSVARTTLTWIPMMHGTTVGANITLKTLPKWNNNKVAFYGYLEP